MKYDCKEKIYVRFILSKRLKRREWEKIKFLFPKFCGRRRPPLNSRTVFNAILWIYISRH